jgi:hypothetical protein
MVLFTVAENDFGRSRPSAELSASTSGSAPLAPPQQQLISVAPGALVLLLSSWKDGGCPISSFVAGVFDMVFWSYICPIKFGGRGSAAYSCVRKGAYLKKGVE